jgi:DNA-binding PadR family transcriptional regulator
MHGYQLNEAIEQRLPQLSSVKPSTAYSRLERLARAGLVTSTTERVGRRPERRVYALTDAGRDRFAALLRDNLRSAEAGTRAADIGLLFSRALPTNDVVALLSERRQAVAATGPRLEALRDRHPVGSPARMVAGRGLALLQAELAWLDRLLADRLET